MELYFTICVRGRGSGITFCQHFVNSHWWCPLLGLCLVEDHYYEVSGEGVEGREGGRAQWGSGVSQWGAGATSEVGTVAVQPWDCSHLQSVSVMLEKLMIENVNIGLQCFINQWDYKWFVRVLTGTWKDLIDWSENYQQDKKKRGRNVYFDLSIMTVQCYAIRWSIMKMSFDKQQTYMNITFQP